MILDIEKQHAFDLLRQGKNVFLTGVAGTGKSFFLKFLKQNYKKRFALTATTGIASVGIGGVTLHSYAGIALGKEPADVLARKVSFHAKKRLRYIDLLVIDEISMLNPDLFDKLNFIFKYVRNDDRPFGGLQLLLIGDFLQLPPVRDIVPEGYEDILFCFETQSWKEANLITVELKTVYRQEDKQFVDVLNSVRRGDVSEFVDGHLFSRQGISPTCELEPVNLRPANYEVDDINNQRLNKISSKLYAYKKKIDHSFDEVFIERLIKTANIPDVLYLKRGAQVIMRVNYDVESGIVNGSMGIVRGFQDGKYPIVEFDNGRSLTITPYNWELQEYNSEIQESEVKARVRQIPLGLAWAITIHKSQGMTIPYVSIDCKNIRFEGQGYVALSRAKSLDGLFLENYNSNRFIAHKKAIDFYSL
jgi:ATP-dependent DNA helicase PIF1